MPLWLIEIHKRDYRVSAKTRQEAIRIAWHQHKGDIGIVINTRVEGESDEESVPWRAVDVAYRILGDYALAKKLDDLCVQRGFPSVLPKFI